MAYSKVWLSLTEEEKRIKRKAYRDKFKTLHPDKVKANKIAYKEKHKQRLRVSQSELQKNRNQSNKLRAIEYKGNKCFDCGNSYQQCCYDFHHLDPDIKDANIAQLISRNFEKIKPELDKCILLCSNCHRIRHFNDGVVKMRSVSN